MKIEGRWNTVAIGIVTVLRVALGALFIISSIAKLQHPDLFVDAVQNYHMLPVGLGDLFGTVLPWAELFVGWCLVLGIFPTFAAAICILMTLTFVVGNVSSFFKDVGEACGMKIMSNSLRQALEKRGAEVDHLQQIVRFPAWLVEETIKEMQAAGWSETDPLEWGGFLAIQGRNPGKIWGRRGVHRIF